MGVAGEVLFLEVSGDLRNTFYDVKGIGKGSKLCRDSDDSEDPSWAPELTEHGQKRHHVNPRAFTTNYEVSYEKAILPHANETAVLESISRLQKYKTALQHYQRNASGLVACIYIYIYTYMCPYLSMFAYLNTSISLQIYVYINKQIDLCIYKSEVGG